VYKILYSFVCCLYILCMGTRFKTFGLSKKGAQVLATIQAGYYTPVQISKQTNISRPAIYAILTQLAEQGLVNERTHGNARTWQIASATQINKLLEQAKSEILGSTEEKEVMYHGRDVEIKVYRGAKTISELMRYIFQQHKDEICIGIQGDNVYAGWRDLLGIETINDLNKSIKKNGLINQAIVPQGHYSRAVDTMGIEWAQHFEGRAYRANEIDEMYFNHKGEMFLFKDSVYLISMTEELVIEIKNSHIQKMLLSLVQYVQNTAHVVDGNELLRELMAKNEVLGKA
jgi:DNA-binding MarR family transcriptional regulator